MFYDSLESKLFVNSFDQKLPFKMNLNPDQFFN